MGYENKMIMLLGEEVFYRAMAEYYHDGRTVPFIEFCRETKGKSLLSAFAWALSKDGYIYWQNKHDKLTRYQ